MSIRSIIILCLGLMVAACGQKEQTEKPNIIFILTDDQRWSALGYAGNDIIQTPEMDKLAAEGVYFKNALVTTPICSASRASIFSGTYERTHRYTFGPKTLRPDLVETSYPRLMKDSGYHTGFFGKYGVKVAAKESHFDVFEDLPMGEGYFSRKLDGKPVHLTRYNGQMALDFIEDAPKDKPFALSLSFNAPHADDKAEEQYFWQEEPGKLYQDMNIPLPENGSDEDFNRLPAMVKEGFNRTRWYWRYDTPEKYQHSVKGYYRMINGIDREIALIREKLKEKGLDKNTVIILMGDNGYFLGERQLAGKWLMYDKSVRVPLIIYDPRVNEHRDLDDMALNIDIPATILDLAGIEIPKRYQGKSLMPVVRGEEDSLMRDAVLIEHLWDNPKVLIPPSEGVRTHEWKYLRYVNNPEIEELYHLKADPKEINNLVADPAHQNTLGKMRDKLEELTTKYHGI